MVTKRFNKAHGFSLIELMIALVAGLIVTGAAITFALSSMRSNTDFVRSTRLTQELRVTMDAITRELRRAGYDEGALVYAMQGVTGTATSDFSPILFNSDTNADGTSDDGCIIYAYDRAPGEPGKVNLSNGEIRGIRLVRATVDGVANVGIIEMAESSAGITPACNNSTATYTTYPPTCNGAWCALSDPRVMNITTFTLDTSAFVNSPATATTTPVQLRDLGLELSGSLIGDTTVVRSVSGGVRVRADCMKVAADCSAAPALTGTD